MNVVDENTDIPKIRAKDMLPVVQDGIRTFDLEAIDIEKITTYIDQLDMFQEQYLERLGLKPEASHKEIHQAVEKYIRDFPRRIALCRENRELALQRLRQVLGAWNIQGYRALEEIPFILNDEILILSYHDYEAEALLDARYMPSIVSVSVSEKIEPWRIAHEYIHALTHELHGSRIGMRLFEDGEFGGSSWLDEGAAMLWEQELFGDEYERDNYDGDGDFYITGYLTFTVQMLEKLGLRREQLMRAHFHLDPDYTQFVEVFEGHFGKGALYDPQVDYIFRGTHIDSRKESDAIFNAGKKWRQVVNDILERQRKFREKWEKEYGS